MTDTKDTGKKPLLTENDVMFAAMTAPVFVAFDTIGEPASFPKKTFAQGFKKGMVSSLAYMAGVLGIIGAYHFVRNNIIEHSASKTASLQPDNPAHPVQMIVLSDPACNPDKLWAETVASQPLSGPTKSF